MEINISIKNISSAKKVLELTGFQNFLAFHTQQTDNIEANVEHLFFNGLLTFNDFYNFTKTTSYKYFDFDYLVICAILFLNFENFKKFYAIFKCDYDFSKFVNHINLKSFRNLKRGKRKDLNEVVKNIKFLIETFLTFDQCVQHLFFRTKFLASICDDIFNCYTHLNTPEIDFWIYNNFDACAQLLEIHSQYYDKHCAVFPSLEIAELLLQKFKDDYTTNSDLYISKIKKSQSKQFSDLEKFIKSKNFEISEIDIKLYKICESVEIVITVISNENPNIKRELKASDYISDGFSWIFNKLTVQMKNFALKLK